MNRKNFLSSVLALGAVLPATAEKDKEESPTPAYPIPKYLKPGDTIGITCPAGYITLKEIQPAVDQIESWGLKVRIGHTVGEKDFTFGGTDEERRADFQEMLDDRSLRAILCARGGYGAIRIVDQLHFAKFAASPKWIIGFSDITVLHAHIQANFHVATIHSKMCNSFPEDWSAADAIQQQSILSIRQLLFNEKIKYTAPINPHNRPGRATGILVGGNLKTIESLSGTKSDLPSEGKILFVEDTGEYLYSIDRMFWNLQRTGKLKKLAALIVGGFKTKPDDPGEEFGKTLEEIVMEKVKKYDYPVCFDFPVGHQKNNFALKCGVAHTISVTGEGTTLVEANKK